MGGIDSLQGLEPRFLFSGTASFRHTTLSFPSDFYYGATTVVGDTAIFAGGYANPHRFAETNRVLFYDAPKHKWSASRLPRGRAEMGATTVGDQALFAGGTVDSGQILTDDMNIFSARTHRWSTAKLSAPREDVAATTVGRLALFAGGYSPAPAHAGVRGSNVVDIYDAKYGRWTTAHLSAAGPCIATSVGKFALFKTATNSGSTVDIYNARENTWTTKQLPAPAEFAASAGHYALFAETTGTIDIFNAASGTWSTAELTGENDTPAGATSVGNDVLIPGFDKEMYVFNAATAQWSTFQIAQNNDTEYATSFTIGNTAYFGSPAKVVDDLPEPQRRIDGYTLK